MTNQSLVLDRVFSALSDPTRRGMVARLVQGPASVSELAKPFSIALPTVVQHLKVLEESGLVSSTKTGRVRTCRLEQGRLDAAQAWLAEQRAFWNARLDRMEKIVMEMDDE